MSVPVGKDELEHLVLLRAGGSSDRALVSTLFGCPVLVSSTRMPSVYRILSHPSADLTSTDAQRVVLVKLSEKMNGTDRFLHDDRW